MAAKLGASCAMVTKVGQDVFGKDTIANYKSHDIDTSHVLEDGTAFTGVAPITVEDSGQTVSSCFPFPCLSA